MTYTPNTNIFPYSRSNIKHPHEEGASRVVGGKDMHPVNFIKHPHLHSHRLTDTSD